MVSWILLCCWWKISGCVVVCLCNGKVFFWYYGCYFCIVYSLNSLVCYWYCWNYLRVRMVWFWWWGWWGVVNLLCWWWWLVILINMLMCIFWCWKILWNIFMLVSDVWFSSGKLVCIVWCLYWGCGLYCGKILMWFCLESYVIVR